VVREFHQKLCHTRVLDPACGSGISFYVTLDLFKRLEGEVLSLLESLGEKQTLMHMESVRVTPAQFHGLSQALGQEMPSWCVDWLSAMALPHVRQDNAVPEPVLHDYKNIECRDAVLAYDGEPELVRDEKASQSRDGWREHEDQPHDGEEIDVEARGSLQVQESAQGEWPRWISLWDPPFIGNKRMKRTLGEGYVESLRTIYPMFQRQLTT